MVSNRKHYGVDITAIHEEPKQRTLYNSRYTIAKGSVYMMRLKETEAKNHSYLAVKYDKTYERLRVFEDLLKEEPKLGF